MTARLAQLLCIALLASPPAAAQEAARVGWKGKEHALEALPLPLQSPLARAALQEWSAWASQRGYKLFLDDSARVLLLAKKDARSHRKELALVDRVLARADALFPMPPPKLPAAVPAPAAPREEEPREDGPDLPGGLFGGEEGQRWQVEWEEGFTQGAQRDALPVLVLLDGDADLARLVEFLVERHPYLADWSAEGRRQAGFLLLSPLLGAWLTQGADLNEWNPHNELVHRLLRLLLLQRHGRVPEWLSQGLGWDAERELLGAIYCYPRRHEFVWAVEHTAWDAELASRFKGRDEKKDPLRMEELAALTRAGFQNDAAILAYGGARFLTQHHPRALAPLLAALEREREEHSRVDQGDGTWVRRPYYEPPQSTQEALLDELVTPEALIEMTRFFKRGRSYRP